MLPPEEIPADSTAPPPLRKGWRFYLGILFFILFLICPAFIPFVVVLPLSGAVQATLAAGLAVGLPEVCAAVAIVLLGRETFNQLLAPVKRLLRRLAPRRQVGQMRHRLGLVLFAAPLINAALFLHLSDWRDLYAGWPLAAALSWDIVFIASFWFLGGSFCEKVLALFVREAVAVLPPVTMAAPAPPQAPGDQFNTTDSQF